MHQNPWLTGLEARSLLIYLNGGHLFIKAYYLAYQLFFADVDHFHHAQISLAFYGNDRAVDTEYYIL